MGDGLEIKNFLASVNKRKHERFTRLGGYAFDKMIFRWMFIIILVLYLGAWALSGFINPLTERISLSCAHDAVRCDNPLYMNYKYKGSAGIPDYLFDDEYLPAGLIINPVPWYYQALGPAFLFVLLGAFLVNHLVHNKGFKIIKNLSEAINMEGDIFGYCMKCREKQIIKDPVIENKQTRRGIKRTAHGTCSICGTKVYVTLKKEA
jgi:hypothetical protein